jgi:hypothetical protein
MPFPMPLSGANFARENGVSKSLEPEISFAVAFVTFRKTGEILPVLDRSITSG